MYTHEALKSNPSRKKKMNHEKPGKQDGERTSKGHWKIFGDDGWIAIYSHIYHTQYCVCILHMCVCMCVCVAVCVRCFKHISCENELLCVLIAKFLSAFL